VVVIVGFVLLCGGYCRFRAVMWWLLLVSCCYVVVIVGFVLLRGGGCRFLTGCGMVRH